MRKYNLVYLIILMFIMGCTNNYSNDSTINNSVVKTVENEKNITANKAVNKKITPQIFLGYKHPDAELGNDEWFMPNQTVDYKIPASLLGNNAYLAGRWKNNPENMELIDDQGSILVLFYAKKVDMYASAGKGTQVYVDLDKEELEYSGFPLKDPKNYNLINSQEYDYHLLNISAKRNGLKIYNITFS